MNNWQFFVSIFVSVILSIAVIILQYFFIIPHQINLQKPDFSYVDNITVYANFCSFVKCDGKKQNYHLLTKLKEQSDNLIRIKTNICEKYLSNGTEATEQMIEAEVMKTSIHKNFCDHYKKIDNRPFITVSVEFSQSNKEHEISIHNIILYMNGENHIWNKFSVTEELENGRKREVRHVKIHSPSTKLEITFYSDVFKEKPFNEVRDLFLQSYKLLLGKNITKQLRIGYDGNRVKIIDISNLEVRCKNRI